MYHIVSGYPDSWLCSFLFTEMHSPAKNSRLNLIDIVLDIQRFEITGLGSSNILSLVRLQIGMGPCKKCLLRSIHILLLAILSLDSTGLICAAEQERHGSGSNAIDRIDGV